MTISRFKSKSFLIVLLASASFFISCKDKEKVTDAPSTVQEATLEQKKQVLQNVAPTGTQTSTSGNVAINPAHGQPGHDCAVPVGAPLNGGGATPTSNPIKVNNNGNTSPIKASTGAGLNPAHGQPGHRCDIKVGDPL